MSKLLPVAEAVKKETGKIFHPVTVARWRREGRLQNCKRIGRNWYCNLEDVRAMVLRDSATVDSEAGIESETSQQEATST